MLKVREGDISLQFSDFLQFQSLAAENWKERWPKEVLALGMTSKIQYTCWSACFEWVLPS
jgi:hypothetical protein